MILKDFIQICEENNIQYFLDGGTLLGAIRHEGYIPWDDDIDVMMLREEYDKFINFMEKNPSEKYDLLSLETKKDYIRAYSKLSLKGTYTGEYIDINTDYKIGISVDIFVLDYVPDNYLKKKIFLFERKIYMKLCWIYEIIFNEFYISKNKERLGKLIKVFFKIFRINSKNIKKLAYHLIEYSNSDSKYLGIISTYYKFQFMSKEWFSSSKKTKFESIEASIPIGHHEYLTLLYGDYMKIPPKEERINHCRENIDFGPYGLDYE